MSSAPVVPLPQLRLTFTFTFIDGNTYCTAVYLHTAYVYMHTCLSVKLGGCLFMHEYIGLHNYVVGNYIKKDYIGLHKKCRLEQLKHSRKTTILLKHPRVFSQTSLNNNSS